MRTSPAPDAESRTGLDEQSRPLSAAPSGVGRTARGMEEIDRNRTIRADLSRLVEPGDMLAGIVIEELGCFEAHSLIVSEQSPGTRLVQRVAEAAEERGLTGAHRDLRNGLERWRTRLSQADGSRDLATIRRFGGGLLCPEDEAWPESLWDLGPAAPVALWWRQNGQPAQDGEGPCLPRRGLTVAVVGSREITDYGTRVCAELTEALVAGGVCVLSGGAYGVDAAAHRAALRTAARREEAQGTSVAPAGRLRSTVAVLAGGLDRLYPAGNQALLQAVEQQGLLLSEMAPGSSPTRHRFLQRNRLIAALCAATLVVEARWRSGAQSTAHHALELGRPVGVVPGSIYSASSAGCHRLLRETPSELITGAEDVVTLISPAVGGPEDAFRRTSPAPGEQLKLSVRPQDGLPEADQLLLDALPKVRVSPPAKLSEVAGLPLPQVLSGLSRLERRGLARQVNGHWGRAG